MNKVASLGASLFRVIWHDFTIYNLTGDVKRLAATLQSVHCYSQQVMRVFSYIFYRNRIWFEASYKQNWVSVVSLKKRPLSNPLLE